MRRFLKKVLARPPLLAGSLFVAGWSVFWASALNLVDPALELPALFIAVVGLAGIPLAVRTVEVGDACQFPAPERIENGFDQPALLQDQRTIRKFGLLLEMCRPQHRHATAPAKFVSVLEDKSS